jgi:glutaredoxin
LLADTIKQPHFMTTTTIYFNPTCSKCRAALTLLRERGIEPNVVSYLEQPPTPAELAGLLNQLGFVDARQLMRKGTPYRQRRLLCLRWKRRRYPLVGFVSAGSGDGIPLRDQVVPVTPAPCACKSA